MDHDLNCTVCDNNMIDFDCEETIALFQQQDYHEMFQVQGTFHVDEVVVSFLSGKTLQLFTRVELLDFQEDFFELVQRQDFATTAIDVLKYKACQVVGLFTVAANVRTEYHEGADFTLDQNGSIKWVGTHRPADRQVYSIYYRYHPVYRAIKAVHRDRFSQYNLRPDAIEAPKKTVGQNTYVKMPETWVLKRDYLIRRKKKDGTVIGVNELYDPNE